MSIRVRLDVHSGSIHLFDMVPRKVLGALLIDEVCQHKKGTGEAKGLENRIGALIVITVAIIKGQYDRPGGQRMPSSQGQRQVVQADAGIALVAQIRQLLRKVLRRHGQVFA